MGTSAQPSPSSGGTGQQHERRESSSLLSLLPGALGAIAKAGASRWQGGM